MRVASVTGKGGRKRNEDSIGKLKRNNIYCFVLADGLGGHGNGDIASGLAVESVLKSFAENAVISETALYGYMLSAQNTISTVREKEVSMRKMGTTLTVLVTDGKKAVWGNCGDSRIYKLNGTCITEISEDHSLVYSQYKRGEITYSQIRSASGKNMVLKSLGDEDYFKPEIHACENVQKGCKFLMCSDGLWALVTEEFMENSLKISTSPNEWIIRLTEERRKKAVENADNFSAIAVFI